MRCPDHGSLIEATKPQSCGAVVLARPACVGGCGAKLELATPEDPRPSTGQFVACCGAPSRRVQRPGKFRENAVATLSSEPHPLRNHQRRRASRTVTSEESNRRGQKVCGRRSAELWVLAAPHRVLLLSSLLLIALNRAAAVVLPGTHKIPHRRCNRTTQDGTAPSFGRRRRSCHSGTGDHVVRADPVAVKDSPKAHRRAPHQGPRPRGAPPRRLLRLQRNRRPRRPG